MSDNQQLLSWLLNRGLTPNFSFPLDACQFSAIGVESWRSHTFASMTQDLRNALREYSPGKEISVDGKEYIVGGLSFFNPSDKVDQAYEFLKPSDEQWTNPHLKWYSRCTESECGWVYAKTDVPYNREMNEHGHLINRDCPLCGSEGGENQRGVVSSQWLRPEGFSPIIVPHNHEGEPIRDSTEGYTKSMKPEQPQRRGGERTSGGGRVELPAPLVSGDEEDDDDQDADGHEDLTTKTLVTSPFDEHVQYLVSRDGTQEQISSPGIELILMNTGFNGRGFWVCARCGRTEVMQERGFGLGQGGHWRPYAPQFSDDQHNTKCMSTEVYGAPNSQLNRLMLGMTFRTDMAILRIPFDGRFIPPEDLARNKELDTGVRALKEALLTEINDVYEFESREISAGFRKWIEHTQDEGTEQRRKRLVLDLFLYDEVPGGAGLSTLLFDDEEKWNRVIQQTEIRLRGSLCLRSGGCDSACNGCLLDFRNGQDHNRMNRQNGLRLLRWLMNQHNLPTLENGDADPTSGESLRALCDLFDVPGNSLVEMQEGALCFKTDGEVVFNLRPVSSLLRESQQPHYNADEGRFEEVSDELELGGAADPDEDPETMFYFPMMDVGDSVVRLEQRMFPSNLPMV